MVLNYWIVFHLKAVHIPTAAYSTMKHVFYGLFYFYTESLR